MDRQRQARWDLENLCSVGTKLLPGQYRILRRACDVEGVSVYALIKRLLFDWLMQWAERHPESVSDVTEAARRR